MLDSANESIAELKASLAAAQQEARQAQSNLNVVESELANMNPEELSQLR